MADIAASRSPIQGIVLPSDKNTLAVSPVAPAVRLMLRADPGMATRLGTSINVEVPTTPSRAATRGNRAVLWLGPDEWLILAPESDRETLPLLLMATASGQPISLVEVSDRQIGLTLTGRRVEEALNVACPLPLDARAFPPGKCTRTLFGKAEIVLWRPAASMFVIEVQRSFAPYVAALLAESAASLP